MDYFNIYKVGREMTKGLKRISRRQLETMLQQEVVSDRVILARIDTHVHNYPEDRTWALEYTGRFKNKYYGRDWFS